MDEYHLQAREISMGVLSRAEFDNLRERTWKLPLWLRSFLKKIGTGIERFFESFPSWVYYLVLIWLVLTLLAILAHIGYVMYGVLSTGGGEARRSTSRMGASQILGIHVLDSRSAYERALDFMERKDWVQATKHLYVTGILRLVENGKIVYRKSKTNRDYLRELRTSPRIGIPFHRLTEIFESRIYGDAPPTVVECSRMNEILRSFPHEEPCAEEE